MKKQAWRCVFGLVSVVLTFSFLPRSAGAETKLLAVWKFNENGVDATGNGHDASFKTGATFVTDAIEGSHSLYINGKGCAFTPPFDLGGQFTITAWTYLMPGQSSIQSIVANCVGGSRISGFKFFVNTWDTADRRLMVEPSDGTNRIDVMSPENTYEESLWNHVAMTADRVNGLIDVFMNGYRVTVSSSTVTGFETNLPLYIGSFPPGNSYNWHGMIDDVRVYEGILTEDEIAASMNPETAVQEPIRAAQPGGFRLMQNHPNPFNPSTVVSYVLPRSGPVSLKVFDPLGRVAAVLAEGAQTAGYHETNFSPDGLAAGIYYCRLQAGTLSQTVKMLYVR